MIRRLTLATVLATLLGIGASGAGAAADELPVDGSTSRGACIVLRPVDYAYCQSNPFKSLPDLPELP